MREPHQPRKSIREAKDLATRAWQVRAQHLDSALVMLASQGLQLSEADREKVANYKAGGVMRRRPRVKGQESTVAGMITKVDEAGLPHGQPAPSSVAKEDLFADDKFKGTHIAAVSSAEIPRCLIRRQPDLCTCL